jgi:hypothetical protein
MFAVNKEGRTFLQNRFITIQNGFINDGLVPFQFECTFNGILALEKLYFAALKRNSENRNITIKIDIGNNLSVIN